MTDPGAADLPWTGGEGWLEADLARARARRAKAAQVMLLILLAPLAAQVAFVWVGAAARWGLMVVALPSAVAWTLLRGPRR